MGRFGKLVLGFVTIWPFLYIFVFITFFIMTFFGMVTGSHGDGIPLSFKIVFPMHAMTMLIGFILIFVYIVLALKNEHLEGNAKLIWVLVLFLGNMFTMPIFWYLYVWNDPVTGPASKLFKKSILDSSPGSSPPD
jgi:hypothetical protein